MTDWCILRCAARRTLELAKSLTEAGIECWTPVEKSPDKAKGEVRPMIETFVFARAAHLVDILDLLRKPTLNYQTWDSDLRRMVTHGHPSFSVFRPFDGYPLIPDTALNHLRFLERRRKPRGSVKLYSVGDRVRILGAGFDGLDGVVTATKGKKATVLFPGKGFLRDVVLPMAALLDAPAIVHVDSNQSEQASHAKAA